MPAQGFISRKEAVVLRPIRRRSLHWALLFIIAIAVLLLWGSHISISSNHDSSTQKHFDDVVTAVQSNSIPSAPANYIAEALESTLPSPYGYDSSLFQSQSRTPLLPCRCPSNPKGENNDVPFFLSQSTVRQTIRKYVSSLKNNPNSNSQPSFIPSLHEIMSESIHRNEVMVTVQLGGMDGKAGDPIYKFTRSHDDISLWMPVVMEPVQRNFDKLVETYRTHMEEKNLACPHLLHQMANYDAQRQKKTNLPNPDNSKFSQQCPFCHFDLSNPSCQDSPDWMKYEVGSMECDVEWKQKCFIPTNFICTSIGVALEGVGLHPRNVLVLQIDVEGFEKEILEGYFLEIEDIMKAERGKGGTFDANYYPPVINFENKVLKKRGQYKELEAWLKGMGYGIFPERLDTLAVYLGDYDDVPKL